MANENTLQLFVHLNGSINLINIGKDQTIHDIKLKLVEKTGIPTNKQRLFLHCLGKVLHDDHKLTDYNIQNHQDLSLQVAISNPIRKSSSNDLNHQFDGKAAFKPFTVQSKPIKLLVEPWHGKEMTVYAHPTDTILTLKQKILKDYSISIKQQCLFLNNEPLKDERPWWSYHIASGTKIKLSFTEYQQYKETQESIVRNTKEVGNKARNEISSVIKHLQTIASTSHELIQKTSNVSSLRALKLDMTSQISEEMLLSKLFSNVLITK
eukprot:177686_1